MSPGLRWLLQRRTHLGTDADRATFRTLHTASLASPALREGLTEASAERSIRHLRALLGAPAVALTDTVGLLAWDGAAGHHGSQVPGLVTRSREAAVTGVLGPADPPGRGARGPGHEGGG